MDKVTIWFQRGCYFFYGYYLPFETQVERGGWI